MDKRYRDQKTQLLLLRSQEENRVLRMPLAHNTTRGMGKASKLSLLPDPWTHTYPYPI